MSNLKANQQGHRKKYRPCEVAAPVKGIVTITCVLRLIQQSKNCTLTSFNRGLCFYLKCSSFFDHIQIKMRMVPRSKQLTTLIVSAMINMIVINTVVAENTVEDFYTWAGFEITGDLPANTSYLRNFKYKLFMQGRFGDSSSRFSQGLIRSGIGHGINEKITVWLGYDWVPTSRPLALRHPFNDHAVWQQLSLKDSYSFGTTISRTRFEQHFFDIPGSTDVAHLYRQMFKLSTTMPTLSPNVSLVVWNEIFVNLNSTDAGVKSGFNQNRAFAGIGYHLNKRTIMEVGYMNQYINRPHNPRPDQMYHVLSVTMLLNF